MKCFFVHEKSLNISNFTVVQPKCYTSMKELWKKSPAQLNCFVHNSLQKLVMRKELVPSKGSLAGGKQIQDGYKFLPRAWGWDCTWPCTQVQESSQPWCGASQLESEDVAGRDEGTLPASGSGFIVLATHQVTPALLFALKVTSFLDICKGSFSPAFRLLRGVLKPHKTFSSLSHSFMDLIQPLKLCYLLGCLLFNICFSSLD